ncbi:MAG: nucleotidyltransferase family protein [Chroococcidiopsidaceae cyanobacterium CP_BM_RX_35]|nr:nucleotidyltransferase family protein [Chroococcidiopsidaceae cyanobacterium CP_BM_RX_35]
MSTIGLVILAAGASRRMGTPKQLLHYQGHSLLRHSAKEAVTSECQPIVVVLGAYAGQIQPEISQLPVQVVENLQWALGMSASIRAGIKALDALSQNLEAVVIVLCDQPFVSADIINQLVRAYYSTRKPIIASEYAGTLGVPALFNKSLFSELAALRGSEGARQVIKKHLQQVLGISFPAGAIDIDTPNDYQFLQILALLNEQRIR